jgi:tight adherence protein B
VRRGLCVVAIAALAGAAVPAAHAETGARLAETAGARFPDRAYTLVLAQDRSLSASQVRVTENGRPVTGLRVTSATSGGAQRFGVVLAIDVSASMRGAPLAAAVKAARTFAGRRAPDQPVAIVAFAGETRVLTPFTTDQATLDEALSRITVQGGGTHIYDAALGAVGLVRDAHIRSGAIVLLSDGGDHGSTQSLKSASTAARNAGARIFTIGLRGRQSDFGTLNLLAADTAGEFSAADSFDALSRVYASLGARLANQYVVQYRSDAAPGETVDVRLRVDGIPGEAGTSYRTSAAPQVSEAPYQAAPLDRLVQSQLFALLVSVGLAAMLTAALLHLLRGPKSTLGARMAEYVGPADSVELTHARGAPAGGLLRSAEKSLVTRAWWSVLQERLEVARIDVEPARLVMWVGLGTFALLSLLFVLGGPLIALLAWLAPLASWQVLQRKVAKQRAQFSEQLPDNLQIIASAMRAGHSFAGALSVVVEDAAEPTRAELRRVISDERLGVPLDKALRPVARRMESRDLEQVALVASLQRETGGNTAEVLDRVADTVRERLALRRSVETLTAQGRLSRWVLTSLPVVLLIAIGLINPGYSAPLFNTTPGRVALVVATVMLVTGSLVIKRIVNIKV